jgi:hypothetical protein
MFILSCIIFSCKLNFKIKINVDMLLIYFIIALCMFLFKKLGVKSDYQYFLGHNYSIMHKGRLSNNRLIIADYLPIIGFCFKS